MSRPTVFPLTALVLLTAATACRARHEDRARAEQRDQVDSLARVAAHLATSDSSPVPRATVPNAIGMPQAAVPQQADGVRIVSTDGAVVYTLLRDTVRLQLSDSVVHQVRQHVNASADSASGNFGAFIARTVAGAVGSAMSFVVKTPVREIRSISAQNGQLRIETGSGLMHANFKTGGKTDHDQTTFAPADADRFVQAVEARRRALGLR